MTQSCTASGCSGINLAKAKSKGISVQVVVFIVTTKLSRKPAAFEGTVPPELELRFWLSHSRWFWRGRRLWLELADVTMGDMQDAKCNLSTLNLSRGR